MAIPRSASLLLGLPLLLAAGCTNSGRTDHQTSWISPGAVSAPLQDETYEIKGKPQTGGGVQAGFGGPGGEVSAQNLERQAIAPQIHYHIHHHHHYHSNGAAYSTPGYAHTSYVVPHHAPMPAYVSPYAHSPNGGNPIGPQGSGPWNWNGYNGPGWGGMPHYNPWINDGAGGLEGE